jgi:hypothetical protein
MTDYQKKLPEPKIKNDTGMFELDESYIIAHREFINSLYVMPKSKISTSLPDIDSMVGYIND